jgi:hypothetical protein
MRSFVVPLHGTNIFPQGSVVQETLRAAVRAGKSAEDAMDMGTILAANKTVDELIEDENKERKEEEKRLLGVEEVADLEDAAESFAQMMEVSAGDTMLEKIRTATGTKTVQDDAKNLIKSWEEKAKRLFDSNVTLITLPSSDKKTREAIAASAAGAAKGNDKSFVGIFFDQGLMGEPVTAPHIRLNAVNTPVVKAGRACSFQMHWPRSY